MDLLKDKVWRVAVRKANVEHKEVLASINKSLTGVATLLLYSSSHTLLVVVQFIKLPFQDQLKLTSDVSIFVVPTNMLELRFTCKDAQFEVAFGTDVDQNSFVQELYQLSPRLLDTYSEDRHKLEQVHQYIQNLLCDATFLGTTYVSIWITC